MIVVILNEVRVIYLNPVSGLCCDDIRFLIRLCFKVTAGTDLSGSFQQSYRMYVSIDVTRNELLKEMFLQGIISGKIEYLLSIYWFSNIRITSTNQTRKLILDCVN